MLAGSKRISGNWGSVLMDVVYPSFERLEQGRNHRQIGLEQIALRKRGRTHPAQRLAIEPGGLAFKRGHHPQRDLHAAIRIAVQENAYWNRLLHRDAEFFQ